MHPEAMEFITRIAAKRGPFTNVVDLGGRDINGSPRALFAAADYTSVDLYPGDGVDVVADARTWTPTVAPDLVVCAEVLEHAPAAHELVEAAAGWLQPGGILIVTAACDPRPPHSAIDGGPLQPGEHYQNIDPGLLWAWMADFDEISLEAHERGDVYAVARKPD
jgi:hypothetical protein